MRVAIVGGGVAGLTAAYELGKAGVDVVVLEGSDRIGGKLRLAEVGGVTLDVGAEALLARRPEATDLCAELGLGDTVVHPSATSAAIWTRGALRPMPPTVLGIPADVDALMASGIVDRPPVSRPVPAPKDDVSVGEFVRAGVGDEVLERLVEPLLGGVYAGHADLLSLSAAGAQILALGEDLLAGAAKARATSEGGPVFAGLVGGVGRLPSALAEASGAEIRTEAVVRDIERAHGGWTLTLVGGTETVDAVVVAAPGPAASRLLADTAPEASFELADLTYASTAIVTFVFDDDLQLAGSGFLVPPVDGTDIKGATFSSQKWSWLAEPGRTVLRASVGRAGDTALLHHDDTAVAATALADLREAAGHLPEPAAWHVQRWGGALPQYEVGHLDRIAVVERAIAAEPGLELCGAAYHGVGVPAVIASAHGAVLRLLADLGH
ncbi:protoporphyrinogen oxidase [Aeromicrobium sp.]|uniref:protoporphyrinogen oxidase n=1 Tax=Aeromicrobium sp. TaxID=1871063 RepID=UPI003C3E3F28